jgi:hypothetical protein
VCSAAAFGQLVCVCPQRDLRELQVVWYIPAGIMTHSRWGGFKRGHVRCSSFALVMVNRIVAGLCMCMQGRRVWEEPHLGSGCIYHMQRGRPRRDAVI